MTLVPLRGTSVFPSEPAALGTGGMLAEKVFQFGLHCNLDAIVPFAG
jgi:hypothetical protein